MSCGGIGSSLSMCTYIKIKIRKKIKDHLLRGRNHFLMRRKELIRGSKERMTHRLVWLGPAIGTGESLNKKGKKNRTPYQRAMALSSTSSGSLPPMTLFSWENLAGLKHVLNQPANQLAAAPSQVPSSSQPPPANSNSNDTAFKKKAPTSVQCVSTRAHTYTKRPKVF
jgi:hypothetical protein